MPQKCGSDTLVALLGLDCGKNEATGVSLPRG
jgi:hypothetical protein